MLLGGSDTLVLQELLKMPQLKSVTVIDTLPLISCLARRFLPNATAALNDPRVDLRILSAEQLQNFVDFSGPSYDTVLVDRPVTGLPLSRNLLDGLKGLLKPSGCLVTSVKSPWQNLPAVKELYAKELPASVSC